MNPILNDENGKPSSTRFVLIWSFFLFSLISICSLCGIVGEEGLTSMLQQIIMVCIGGTAARSAAKNLRGG